MHPRQYDQEAAERAKALRAAYDSDPEGIKGEIKKEVSKYHFYHDIEIVPGVRTDCFPHAHTLVNPIMEVSKQLDFKGKRVLDIGCRDGAMALYAESMGASEVYGIDNDCSMGLMNFVIPFKNSSIKLIECNLNELDRHDLGQFDIIFFCGVLYHLQSPFWGLRQVAQSMREGGTVILETSILDVFHDFPIVAYLTYETSPYEATSPTFYNLAGLRRAVGLFGFEEYGQSTRWKDKPVDAGKYFPEFAKHNDQLSKIDVYRQTTLFKKVETAKLKGLEGYFEGLHSMHSKGKDRWN
ncbi:MAG: DUF1698 domain-containing protein [Alphaproteobacteria bacterium]|nr:DUF1698 domain-containing protein [Alphaproteobacteria bacterium]